MTISLAVIGVSHHTAPVEIRERMAFGSSEASRALLELREELGVEEAVLLSTCNRTEIYLSPVRPETDLSGVEALFRRKSGEGEAISPRHLFRKDGEAVVEHLFGVCAGLDSMVTGEAEIQGQVKEAYERSLALGVDPPMAGPVVNRLFQTALSVGGTIRAETPINEGAASVASVAVELARKIFGQLRGKRILVLGAGATAQLMVEALGREGVRGILVANRTYERAEALAERLDGDAVPIDRLEEALPQADIILSSTGAPHHLLTGARFRTAFPKGRRHPLLIIDIALPRDVDPRLGDENEVYLYNLDDLRKIVDEHVALRSEAIPEAERIIRGGVEEFRGWYASLQVVPVIRRMRRQAEAHRAAELERLFGRLDSLGSEERGRIEEFSRRLLNKLLHDPTVRLRKGMATREGADLVEAVRFLYGLEVPEENDEADGAAAGRSERSEWAEPEGEDHPGGSDAPARSARNPHHGAIE